MARKPPVATSISAQEGFGFLAEKLRIQAREPNLLAYVPHAKQELFHRSLAKIKLYIGGNRSGKTHGGVVEDIYRLKGIHPYRKVPEGPVRGRAVCVDFRQGINEILIPKFRQLIPPSLLIGGSWDRSYNTTEKKLTCSNRSTLEFMTYEQSTDAFAGTSRHFIHYDEEPPKPIYNECQARLIDTDGDAYLTMTPLLGMCVDSQTEVLTQDGWKKFNELISNEIIMTHQGWKKLQGLYVNDQYQGYLNSLSRLDTYFTPKHKWLTQRGLVEENNLKSDDYIKINIDNYNDTAAEYWSEEFLELLGWLIGDGTIPGDAKSKVVFYQNYYKYEENCDRFEYLVESCGGKWNEGKGASSGNLRYTVCGDLGRSLHQLLENKKILSYRFLSLLSHRGIEAILKGIVGSDGHVKENGTQEITTVSLAHANQYMALGALAGYVVSRSESEYVGRNKLCYKIRLRNKIENIDNPWILKGSNRIENAIYYKGTVWCPNTEAGTFLAKRNGSVYLTGNTWLFDEIYIPGLEGDDPNLEVITVDIMDNPYLPAEARDRYLASITDPEERKARQSGKFIRLGGLVYKTFNKDHHVIPFTDELVREVKKYELYTSMDHGFNAPSAWLWHGVAADGTVVTFAEHYERELIVSEHAEKVKEIEKLFGITGKVDIRIADPATAQRQGVSGTSIQTEYALNDIDLSPGNNDVQTGVAKVQQYLRINPATGKPYWLIADNCVNLIREMERLRWATYATKKGQFDNNPQEKIHKKDDHACLIADTEVLTNKGTVKIKNILPGTLVATRDGYKKVTASGITSMSEDVYKLILNNGKELIGTASHPIAVSNGIWKSLDSLRYSDTLTTWSIKSYFKLLYLGVIQSLKIGRKKVTTPLEFQINKKGGKDFTRKSGCGIGWRIFRKVSLSTILTLTLSIMILKTLNALNILTISNSIEKTLISQKKDKKLYIKHKKKLKNGMLQKKVTTFINGLGKWLGSIENPLLFSASSVINFLRHSILEELNFAPTTVNQLPEENLVWMTSNIYAKYVEKYLRKINMLNQLLPVRVFAVQHVGKEIVYNLTIEDCPEFYANGILVHNCDSARYFFSFMPELEGPEVVERSKVVATGGLEAYDKVLAQMSSKQENRDTQWRFDTDTISSLEFDG